MRIAEFLGMSAEQVREALNEYDRLAEEEGLEAWDMENDSGAALLMEEITLDAVRAVDKGDRPPTILRMAIGKAFRAGCSYGRAVIPPEDRD